MSEQSEFRASYIELTIAQSKAILEMPLFRADVGDELAAMLGSFLDQLCLPQIQNGKIVMSPEFVDSENIPVITLSAKEELEITFIPPTSRSIELGAEELTEIKFFAESNMATVGTVQAIIKDAISTHDFTKFKLPAHCSGMIFNEKFSIGPDDLHLKKLSFLSRSLVVLQQFPGKKLHPNPGTLLHECTHGLFNLAYAFSATSQQSDGEIQMLAGYDELRAHHVAAAAIRALEPIGGYSPETSQGTRDQTLVVDAIRVKYADPESPYIINEPMMEALNNAGLATKIFQE